MLYFEQDSTDSVGGPSSSEGPFTSSQAEIFHLDPSLSDIAELAKHGITPVEDHYQEIPRATHIVFERLGKIVNKRVSVEESDQRIANLNGRIYEEATSRPEGENKPDIQIRKIGDENPYLRNLTFSLSHYAKEFLDTNTSDERRDEISKEYLEVVLKTALVLAINHKNEFSQESNQHYGILLRGGMPYAKVSEFVNNELNIEDLPQDLATVGPDVIEPLYKELFKYLQSDNNTVPSNNLTTNAKRQQVRREGSDAIEIAFMFNLDKDKIAQLVEQSQENPITLVIKDDCLATAGSITALIDLLISEGVKIGKVIGGFTVAYQPGMEVFAHKMESLGIPFSITTINPVYELNEHGYLVQTPEQGFEPGTPTVGDMGDIIERGANLLGLNLY